jgi:uncharacterized membrane protein YfcA
MTASGAARPQYVVLSGGYGGARFAKRLGQRTVRRIVILIGLGMAAWMFARQLA